MKNTTWIILILAGAVIWYLYKKSKKITTPSTATGASKPATGGTTATGTVSQPTGNATPQPYVMPALPSQIWTGIDKKKLTPQT
jgi:hypothetical protein